MKWLVALAMSLVNGHDVKMMIEKQLKGRDITDERVLRAMKEVPREEFVPESLKKEAYEDSALPIGHDQTISQPYVVAFMAQSAKIKPTDKVLEIGTGSGYHAAVLSKLAKKVFTIEIVKPLGEKAQKRFKKMNYDNIKVRIGDGYNGWKEEAPFDVISVTAAPEKIPEPLIDQLKEGGRLIIPVGEGIQELQRVTKTNKGVTKESLIPVRFVPLTRE